MFAIHVPRPISPGSGLDSSELGHPPEKFARVFQEAIRHGLLTVAHAGEEGPVENIHNSLELLNISRIDHGVRCVDDQALVADLANSRVPLTVCPLSNTRLKVFDRMDQHNIVELLRRNVCVTINSDDPAYFGGYMTDNFQAVADSHGMTPQELAQFTLNAIEASFIDDGHKQRLTERVQDFVRQTLAW